MTPFPPIVILNGGKNTVWEKREMEWWHGVKNLLHRWRLTVFLITVTDPSRLFRMTINVLYKDHIIKEYLACSWQLTADSFYLLTAFLTTGIDPSRLFRITINISLIIAPYRIPSFRAEVRMLYEKTGRRLCDTERRIYYSDDVLPIPSLWRLAVRCHSDKHSLYKVIFSIIYRDPDKQAVQATFRKHPWSPTSP